MAAAASLLGADLGVQDLEDLPDLPDEVLDQLLKTPSRDTSGDTQLEAVLEKIRQNSCKLERKDADLLLRKIDDESVKSAVPRRRHQNKVHPSGNCTFFVTPDGEDSGKKRSRPEHDWVESKRSTSYSLTSSKDGQPYLSPFGEHEGVVKVR